jgi:transcriptional regulator with XRE-family HTH domain
MVAAREKQGLTQGQLAARIGVKQPTISAIENGSGSAYIPDVCRVLKIPGPMFGFTPQQREWAILGHELERKNGASFLFTLNQLRELLAQLPEPPTDEDPPEPPQKQKMKPMGSANVVVIDRRPGRSRMRDGDELSGESKKRR